MGCIELTPGEVGIIALCAGITVLLLEGLEGGTYGW